MCPIKAKKHEAVLMVLSEPGEAVDLKEFNEWYDEEHLPLRMGSFPEFLTGARYEAIDGQQPSFAAVYEVATLGLFAEAKYQRLRMNRSAREAELFSRIGIIDRRTYRTVHVDRRATIQTSHYYPFILTVELVELTILQELVKEIRSFLGWRKTQLCAIEDSSIVGHLHTTSSSDSTRVPQHLLIFEFEDEEYEKSEQLKKLSNSSGLEKIAIIRKWKIYRE